MIRMAFVLKKKLVEGKNWKCHYRNPTGKSPCERAGRCLTLCSGPVSLPVNLGIWCYLSSQWASSSLYAASCDFKDVSSPLGILEHGRASPAAHSGPTPIESIAPTNRTKENKRLCRQNLLRCNHSALL